ncbi:CoA pyrophosphatase [Jeongeupia chitinilytica]|uniref:Coenzyme A pyrophosphatase n=1 Tax=Jeongeupia chitinilytica TaxID=1041641 RepID=A0ABQ3GYG1_9NEIS|nr:CoA pyrophosphatase [Jeongeupia chitinilytica]GHD58512.1 coenzyme A pyrophosphatase [Jeongeupia chitinilytica]
MKRAEVDWPVSGDPRVWADWLRARLAGSPRPESGDFPFEQEARPAAVLIAIVPRIDGVSVLLTERAAHLPTHGGQISFPGGRVENDDDGAIAAALRESREEIGLDGCYVRVIDTLGAYYTVSGYAVTPVIGVLDPGFSLTPSADEVEHVFELPLQQLLNPSLYERRWVERRGLRGQTHFIEIDGYTVWGATANMLLMLAAALGIGGEPVDVA